MIWNPAAAADPAPQLSASARDHKYMSDECVHHASYLI